MTRQRDPATMLRGVAAGVLVMEAVVLLLAIQPIRVLGGQLPELGMITMVVLAGTAVVLAGALRRRDWAWQAGTALQICVVLAGFFQWSLVVIGLAFGGIWLYTLRMRRLIPSGPSPPGTASK